MSRLFLSTAVAGLLLGVTTPAMAQEAGQTQIQQQDWQQQDWQQQADPGADAVVTARDVIGMDLASVDGDNLGEVEDIVYDTLGQYYLVISRGGFLGMGQEQYLVPMDRVSYGQEILVVLTEAELMEGYDPNRYMAVEPDFEMSTGY